MKKVQYLWIGIWLTFGIVSFGVISLKTDASSLPLDSKNPHVTHFGSLSSPYTISPPTLDGVINAIEWSDAAVVDISDTLDQGGDGAETPGSVILYIKNDSNFIYLGIDAVVDTGRTPGDNFTLYFDDSHDGTWPLWPDSSEGILFLEVLGTDRIRYNPSTSDSGFLGGYVTSLMGVFDDTLGNMSYEIAIPLRNSPVDPPEYLDAGLGNTAGLWVRGTDFSTLNTIAWWPQDGSGVPDSMGDLELGYTVGVEEEIEQHTIQNAILYQNQPNPFNQFTMIRFQLSDHNHTTLNIYNLSGRLVRTLVMGEGKAGRFSVTWDGRDEEGMESPSGIYFYRLTSRTWPAGEVARIRKMLLLK